jgi:hypothetical protein
VVEQQDAAARWVGQQRDKHEGAGRGSGSMNEDHVFLRKEVQADSTQMEASISTESGTCAGGADENGARLARLLTGSRVWSTRER